VYRRPTARRSNDRGSIPVFVLKLSIWVLTWASFAGSAANTPGIASFNKRRTSMKMTASEGGSVFRTLDAFVRGRCAAVRWARTLHAKTTVNSSAKAGNEANVLLFTVTV